jgi:diguanylate cyclase (GGDEF)-like protein
VATLRDEATGLFSWDAFLAIADMVIGLTRRRRSALSLLLVSVDEPRRVSGDVAVRALSTQVVRASDTVARQNDYGMAMLAPDASPAGASRLAERIRRSAADHIETPDGPIPFRVSIGIATLQQEDTGLEDLLQRAQKALAEAIAAGGNRTRVSGEKLEADY